MNLFLVWSNEHNAWWRPNSCGYTGDMWSAGRYDEARAREACGRRDWPHGSPPPEVMVVAPENERDTFTVAEICAIPDLMLLRVKEATLTAIVERAGRVTTT